MKPIGSIQSTAAAIGLLLCWSTAFATETVLVDGVPHVKSGASPSQGRTDVHLKELWRAGGEDGDILLGAPGAVLTDADGNIYIMDSQLCEVTVFAPDGGHLRTLGGEGDGPGEIRRLGSIFFMEDGQLAMAQTYPGRIITLNLDGTPGRSFHFKTADMAESNFGVIIGGRERGGSFFLTGFTMHMTGPQNTQTYYLSQCDDQGLEKHRHFSKDYTINYADFVADEIGIDFVWSRWDLGPDGFLYAAPHRNRYEIQVLDEAGKLLRVITREYTSYKRSADEKEQARLFVEAYNRNHPTPPRQCNVEDLEADITGLRVEDSGEIWVSTSRSFRDLPEGVALLFDVFDSKGEFVRQTAVHGDFDPTRDLVQFLKGGAAW
ncbi:hypothetical protein ACFL6M_00760 [Candidatus Eisenbacteria bacterium]|uniref:6-bladed beta-propeller n=1 Tax=Eiseniibacteriota bacterium TaxID=2212470 RepID=A0ABV6YIE0_UNCEI